MTGVHYDWAVLVCWTWRLKRIAGHGALGHEHWDAGHPAPGHRAQGQWRPWQLSRARVCAHVSNYYTAYVLKASWCAEWVKPAFSLVLAMLSFNASFDEAHE